VEVDYGFWNVAGAVSDALLAIASIGRGARQWFASALGWDALIGNDA
jgi:hypothetical protein